MSKKKKLEKYEENKQSHNVIEEEKAWFDTIKGNWFRFFQNKNPITLELACGWGEYTLALAQKFPQRNFIGLDIKGDRIWKGSQLAQKLNLNNVAFLRVHIVRIEEFFQKNEIDEIWLMFPDPRPKIRDEKHRLSNRKYLNMYQNILNNGGWFKLKTDSSSLFNYTLEELTSFCIKQQELTFDLYHSKYLTDHYDIKTKYEKIWTSKGKRIKYIKLQF